MGTPKPASERVPIQHRVQRAAELRRLGLTRKQIAQRMSVSPPTVGRWLELAQQQELLDNLPAS